MLRLSMAPRQSWPLTERWKSENCGVACLTTVEQWDSNGHRKDPGGASCTCAFLFPSWEAVLQFDASIRLDPNNATRRILQVDIFTYALKE